PALLNGLIPFIIIIWCTITNEAAKTTNVQIVIPTRKNGANKSAIIYHSLSQEHFYLNSTTVPVDAPLLCGTLNVTFSVTPDFQPASTYADFTGRACITSFALTGRTWSILTSTTATVSPAKLKNSSVAALPFVVISTTVPTSPAINPSSGKSTVKTACSNSCIILLSPNNG